MTNFDGVCDDISWKVLALKECPNCQLMIYHLDMGTMYPNIIILMNRMQVGVSCGCGLMVI